MQVPWTESAIIFIVIFLELFKLECGIYRIPWGFKIKGSYWGQLQGHLA